MNKSGATDLTQEKKPTKKICCACPETKVCHWTPFPFEFVGHLLITCDVMILQKVRDECIALHGPDSEECQKLIEAHKACLRAEGFKVGEY